MRNQTEALKIDCPDLAVAILHVDFALLKVSYRKLVFDFVCPPRDYPLE